MPGTQANTRLGRAASCSSLCRGRGTTLGPLGPAGPAQQQSSGQGAISAQHSRPPIPGGAGGPWHQAPPPPHSRCAHTGTHTSAHTHTGTRRHTPSSKWLIIAVKKKKCIQQRGVGPTVLLPHTTGSASSAPGANTLWDLPSPRQTSSPTASCKGPPAQDTGTWPKLCTEVVSNRRSGNAAHWLHTPRMGAPGARPPNQPGTRQPPSGQVLRRRTSP